MVRADEGIHRAVDSFRDRFPVLQLARFEITAHFLLELGLTVLFQGRNIGKMVVQLV